MIAWNLPETDSNICGFLSFDLGVIKVLTLFTQLKNEGKFQMDIERDMIRVGHGRLRGLLQKLLIPL